MKKLIVCLQFFLLFWTSLSVFAAEPSINAVVKVESGLCSRADRDFHGTGTLFENNGDFFVLTSEHVVLHDNGKYCHLIKNQAIGTAQVRLLAADWGAGLALLKVEKSKELDQASGIPTLAELSAAVPPQNSDSVVVAGYPYATNSLIWDAKGNVLVNHSDRTLIPLVSDVVEIENAHGEYGMSGGPVFSSGSHSFIGVLSHQIIKIVLGEPSQIVDWSSEKTSLQNHLVVIPASTATQWMKRYFSAPSAWTSSFVRDADLQFLGREVIISSGLRFELIEGDFSSDPSDGSNPNSPSDNGVGGGDGAGSHGRVGGGDGAGSHGRVGGGDGAGSHGRVGGGPSENSSSNENLTHPSVSITQDNDSNRPATTWLIPSPTDWLTKIKNLLEKRELIQVPFLLRTVSDDRDVREGSIESLSQFFHDLRKPGVRAKVRAKATLPDGAAQLGSKALKLLGEQLSLKAQGLKLVSGQSLEVQQLLTSLKTAGDILSTGEADGVRAESMKTYLACESAWSALFTQDFDNTVELRKLVIDATKLLSL